MIIDPEDLDPTSSYKLLIGSVLPRAIAWVSTNSAAGVGVSLDITDLLLVGQSAQSQLRFRFRIQFTHVVRIWRLNDSACAVEKTIKFRVQRLRRLLGRRFVAFH